MKKTMLALSVICMSLCACNKTKVNSNSKESISSNSSSSVYVRPDDWYTPRYYESFVEPHEYESLLEYDYKDDVDREKLFKYLSKIEDKNYVENFPVPLNENEEVVLDRFYTSSYYDCCKEEFKRISLNCKFEISEPYYRYGMRTDYYGEDIYHIVVDSYTNGDVIVDKYYRYYTNEELTLAQVESYMGSSHWKSTSHWSGNFVPDNKYKECKKFELDLVFFTGTRMFFSYDSMRNLDKVRIYEKTPWWGAHIDIVGLE